MLQTCLKVLCNNGNDWGWFWFQEIINGTDFEVNKMINVEMLYLVIWVFMKLEDLFSSHEKEESLSMREGCFGFFCLFLVYVFDWRTLVFHQDMTYLQILVSLLCCFLYLYNMHMAVNPILAWCY